MSGEEEEASPRGQASLKGRNIVLLSDGTGNSSAKLFRTNVWKLYRALDLADPQKPEDPRQFALYDDGVGSSSFKPLALLGGVFGFGLKRNVVDLYAFVCRLHRPGDSIYVLGFSRGAFTARIVTGLIVSQGLVPYDGDEGALRRNAEAAYRAYRTERTDDKWRLETLGRRVANTAIRAWRRWRGLTLYEDMLKGVTDKPNVAFVGVWDTVAAYGLPIHELTRAFDRWVWRFSMPDNDLSEKVDRAMHALALDEERRTFAPELWNEREPFKHPERPAPNAGRDGGTIEGERLSQVWFAGAHADIGGGYPDDALSNVPLLWMMAGAEKAGLRFRPLVRAEYEALSDGNGLAHDSRQGLSTFYRYTPRRIERIAPPDATDARGKRRRVSIPRMKIHEGALRRIADGQDGYAPIAAPAVFDVAKLNGTITPGATYLGPGFDDAAAAEFGREREHVYTGVFLRRAANLATLGLAFFIAVMPAIAPAAPGGACRSWLCFGAAWLAPVRAATPAIAGAWLDSFSSHPALFTALVGLLLVSLYAGGSLDGAIHDRMRAVWARVPRLQPISGKRFAPPAKLGSFARGVERLRLSGRFESAMRFVRSRVLPSLAFMFALALTLMLTAKAFHSMLSAAGGVCVASRDGDAPVPAGAPRTVRFRTDDPCQPTQARLEQGATYRLTYVIPADQRWRDAGVPAGPYGNDPEAQSLLMTLAVPLRRHWAEPWFKPMARIGAEGSDVYALDPEPPIARRPEPDAETVFAATITARTTGELFLYVNDAVGLPLFYANNCGRAVVTIERLAPARPPENQRAER